MGVPAPRRRSRRPQSRHRGVLGDRRHADAPQRDQRDAVDEAGELRAAVRALAGRRSRPEALVHGLLVWSQLFSPDRIEHALLRPILIHCVDDAGRPALTTATRSPRTPPLARNDWRDIPATVEALRQFW